MDPPYHAESQKHTSGFILKHFRCSKQVSMESYWLNYTTRVTALLTSKKKKKNKRKKARLSESVLNIHLKELICSWVTHHFVFCSISSWKASEKLSFHVCTWCERLHWLTKYLNILGTGVLWYLSVLCHRRKKIIFWRLILPLAPQHVLIVNVSVLLFCDNKHSRRAKEKCWETWQVAAV